MIENVSSPISLPYLQDEQTSMQQSSHSFMQNGRNSCLFMAGSKLFSWFVGEKHVGLDKNRQASQKEHVVLLQHLSQLLTRSIFCRLDSIVVAWTFRQVLLIHSLLFFHFWFASFRFFKLAHGYFYGLGLFIPKGITPRKMLAWWLINWVAMQSSHLYNPVKVVSVDCITSQDSQSRDKLLLPA